MVARLYVCAAAILLEMGVEFAASMGELAPPATEFAPENNMF